MKTIGQSEATATLAEYAEGIGEGPLILTQGGGPVAALVSIENADQETVSLGSNPEFIDLVERSRSRARTEGGVSSQEMRRRFE